MDTSTAVEAYAKVSIESNVLGASPHRLISLLFEGALSEIARAKKAIIRKEIAAKGGAISRAISIIGEGLNASLDKKAGGELAQNLSALYDYMALRLLTANLTNDIAILDEVELLLTELKAGWNGIRPNNG